MGQHADDFLDEVFEMEEARFEYRFGEMTTEEAYDRGIIDELGFEDNAKTGASLDKTPLLKRRLKHIGWKKR